MNTSLLLQSIESYKYHLPVIGLALAVIVQGSGKFSVDRKLVPAS